MICIECEDSGFSLKTKQPCPCELGLMFLFLTEEGVNDPEEEKVKYRRVRDMLVSALDTAHAIDAADEAALKAARDRWARATHTSQGRA